MSMKTRKIICKFDYVSPCGEFHGVCTLPANHAGDHDLRDAMGMCLLDPNCRADTDRWVAAGFGDSTVEHNHL